MGKKFKAKTCVYCSKPKSSQTGDHVFAREFFPLNMRENLPKVSACTKCNNEKSDLEHYLTTVLPLARINVKAIPNIEEVISRRLQKNKKSFNHLFLQLKNVWKIENGIFQLKAKMHFDHLKLDKLFYFIIKGVMWHHFNVLLNSESFIRAGCLKKEAEVEDLLNNLFNKDAIKRVKNDLGGGTIKYEGAKHVNFPEVSFWKFSVYGGLNLGDSTAPSEGPTFIWGLTCRNN